jgi:hypothetical protein
MCRRRSPDVDEVESNAFAIMRLSRTISEFARHFSDRPGSRMANRGELTVPAGNGLPAAAKGGGA